MNAKELAERQSRRLACGFVIDKEIVMPMKLVKSEIPIPEYPFDDMEVGDSFVVHGLREADQARNKASLAGYRSGCKYASRIVGHDSLRIWRVE